MKLKLFVFSLFWLSGCGQMGPLVLPEEQHAPETTLPINITLPTSDE